MGATLIPVPNSGEVVASSWGAAVAAALNGIQSGTANVVFAAQNSAIVVVTFPRPYSVAPIVIATPLFVGGFFAAVNAVTPTQVTLACWFRDATAQSVTVPVSWVAIGLP